MRPQLLAVSVAAAALVSSSAFAQQVQPRQVLDSLASIAADPLAARRSQRADGLTHLVKAAGTLPAADSTVLFLYRGPAKRASVAGDFNGWDPRPDTLAPIGETGFFVLEKTFAPAARFEYKVVADSAWILDPFNNARAMGGFGPNSEMRMPGYLPPLEAVRHPGVPVGRLDTLSIASPTLGRTHPVYVYLPAQPRTKAGGTKLPVIFVLDGGEYLSLASMATILDNLIFARRIPPIAAVFIDPRIDPREPSSTTRMQDYTMNPAFVAALVDDFREPLVRRYDLSTSPAETGIMGASLGGLAATYAAFTRPDVFGLCGAQSASYQWQKGALLEMARRIPPSGTRFSIDTGTMRDALELSHRMQAILSGRGFPVMFRTAPEGHNWVSWRARIAGLLEYLFATSPLDRLGIPARGKTREFSFTNKRTAFYYGSASSNNSGSWMGFHAGGQKLFDDYTVSINGRLLDRASGSATVYPDRLVRTYPGGITEEFRLADSIPAGWILIRTPRKADVRISLARRSGTGSSGAHVALVTRSIPENHGVVALFSAGAGEREARRSASWAIGRLDSLAQARRGRMERILALASVSTSDARFDAAFSWALLSLDALIMDQGKKGIYAGLPWFTNFWGRDTFISFPGAFLVTGRFREAREVLLSFASFQQLDTNSADYGRIPNIVNPGDVAYNTADGTPRFVLMAREYVSTSGDTGFARIIYPAIVRSIEGTIRCHTDSLGFLVHGAAETWMDAVGPDGPWSPRGNRANDIQSLWAGQLSGGVEFARALDDTAHLRSWQEAHRRLRANFERYFVVNGRIVDHLQPDGTPDHQERPNTLFTELLAPAEIYRAEIRNVVTRLTYPHGVASLAQSDGHFHPYHEYPPYYPKDAAYHNGTVWTWLQGKLISELAAGGRSDLAWSLTQNAVHQILDQEAAGTQSELLDAVPRPREIEPRLSGTFSQAWNLAEFIRTFFESYLGAKVRLASRSLDIAPVLPPSLSYVGATVYLDGAALRLEITRDTDTTRIVIDARNLSGNLSTRLRWDGRHVEFPLTGGGVMRCVFAGDTVVVQGEREPVAAVVRRQETDEWLGRDLVFATPAIAEGLQALKGPSYPLIGHGTIKKTSAAARLLVDAFDPEHDDSGVDCTTGRLLHFTYPRSPSFVPGSFDITRFTARIDSDNLYCTLRFRKLSDPGWHPEYGFQLTYCAIAIDTSPGGTAEIGHNSFCRLGGGAGFERLILVGGGVQVEDEKGRILGAYLPVPEDVSLPLGDAQRGTITFAIPLTMLGPIDRRTRYTILAGAQDDHGGAGIGEFRTVSEHSSEWNGGGRIGGSNIYDRLDVK